MNLFDKIKNTFSKSRADDKAFAEAVKENVECDGKSFRLKEDAIQAWRKQEQQRNNQLMRSSPFNHSSPRMSNDRYDPVSTMMVAEVVSIATESKCLSSNNCSNSTSDYSNSGSGGGSEY